MRLHQPNLKQQLTWRRLMLGACLLMSTCATIQAQGGGIDPTGTGGRHSIRGRLVFPSGQRADSRLKVRLESTSSGDLSVLSDMNGSFSFQSLRPGGYTVVVEGGDFFETARESVFIEPGSVSSRRMPGIPISRPFTVQVYLRPKPTPNSTKPGLFNAALAGLPKRAVDHYLQALESVAKSNVDKAIEQLTQAVAIYPRFGLALNELGVQYLKIGQLEKAGEALRSAVVSSPETFEPRLNYGVVLLNQRKFADAEVQLRQAVKKNDSAVTAHLYLGITLVNLKSYLEAETELQKAIALGGMNVGQAHYYLGGLYWRARNYTRAVEELEKYLQLEPKAANAEKIRATIKDLRNKS